ncbi:ankyrin repeat domain-containing protein [Streptomyces sp. NPDC058284]|uniref:ankyrin repeat domain-containing protein n=1 Tax=unclassified Streptomyces TaxID=2593676 RepID=UPI00364C45D5
MGFFDDLAAPEEPAGPRDEVARLGPWEERTSRERPPVDWFSPALVPQLAVAGGGPAAKVLVTGWSVWPDSVTLHLSVHRSVHWQGRQVGRQSGLRVGLLLGDGRRVTSLDTPEEWVLGPAQMYAAMTGLGKATGLIPLDPGSGDARRSLYRRDVDLHLPELPPPGETLLVVEWPDEEIPETRTPVDADALRAATARALEVWPDLPSQEAGTGFAAILDVQAGGPPEFLARPLSAYERRMLREQEEERLRYVPRADWEGMRYEDWGDAALIRARLDGGAPADADSWSGATPLHLAAERGGAEAVAALLPHVTRVDAPDDEEHTALWHAACRGDEGSVRALIGAGADVWSPQTGPWSPGRLLLTTPLAPVVAELPGAVALPADELAAFRAADTLVEAFGAEEPWTEGLGIAFVRDLDEDEVIRRLGADPAHCPEVTPEDGSFDEEDREEEAPDDSLRYVSVTALPGSPGGCVITQDGYMPSDDAVLRAISPGTSVYALYFNPKGGTHGTLARDGELVDHEEVGLSPDETDRPAHWHFRFWQSDSQVPYTARTLAYACAAAGLRVTDGRVALDDRHPRRRVELPPELTR